MKAETPGQFVPEQALQKNYKLLDRIFATTHFCIVYLDRDFNFVQVNKAYADACGHAPEFFVAKNLFDLYPSECAQAVGIEFRPESAPGAGTRIVLEAERAAK